MDWQPIETAPKGIDLILCRAGFPGSVWLARDEGIVKRIWYRKGSRSRLQMRPTHWMPIPVPPESK